MQDPGGSDRGGSFGRLLRQFREARSLTQEELAGRAALTVKAVGALERGERTRPYPHTVRALADALELDADERARLVQSVPRRAIAPSAVELPSSGHAAQSTATYAMAAPPHPIIGREDAVTQVLDAIRRDRRRLITLTGPGGVGKTRLATEIATRLAADLPGGWRMVELADVRDPSAVLPAIAAALGMPEVDDDDSVAALVPFLSGRRMLVLLDNLEQVLACAPSIARLVAQCSELVVLATSRAPLRIRAEHQVDVPPLEAPAVGAPIAVDDPRAFPAVQMFYERSAAAGSPIDPAVDDPAVVAAICRRLDGLPLALELAAAITRVLPPPALLERLQSGGPALDGSAGAFGLRDLPDRQRTLAATLDWSHDLLDVGARAVFARLAVFSAGFSLDALNAVVDSDEDAFGALAMLVDQSLVARMPTVSGEARFRLLEPVREYASGRLRAAGRAEETGDRHAAYFCELARAAYRPLRGPDLVTSLDRLEREHANLRSAFLRLLDTGRYDGAADFVRDIWLYLALRGHAREGGGWANQLRITGLSDTARCAALTAAAGLSFVTGGIADMRDASGTAVVLSRILGRDDLVAEAAILAGSGAVFAGDLGAADAYLEEALSRAHMASDSWAGTHAVIAQGQRALVGGDYELAQDLLRRAEEAARDLGNPFTLATALNIRATLTQLQNDDAGTAHLLAESIAISVEARISWTLGYAIPALAGVAVRLSEPELAARLFGASASHSVVHAVDPRFPASRALSDRDLAAARDQLGDAAFRDAWDDGRTAAAPDIAELARHLTQRALG